jgi:hypothetical protein
MISSEVILNRKQTHDFKNIRHLYDKIDKYRIPKESPTRQN